jgi:hypothetical protein
VPGKIRTCDLRIRNPLLYPTELRAHYIKNGRGGKTRTCDPSLPKRVRYQLRYAPTKHFITISCVHNQWGERRDSNPRLSEPQSDALPPELRPPSLSTLDQTNGVLFISI